MLPDEGPGIQPAGPVVPTRRGLLLPAVDPATATPALHVSGSAGWLVPWSDGHAVVVADVLAATAVWRARRGPASGTPPADAS